MRRRETKRIIVTLVAVAVFILSMVIAGSNASIPKETANEKARTAWVFEGESPHSTTISDEMPGPDGGANVWWHKDANSTSDEGEWSNRNWLFGPSPSFDIYHENGTLLTKDSYAEINEVLKIVATIPKGVFTQGASLGGVELNGWYMTPDWNYSANFHIRFDGGPWAYERWTSGSYQYNNTEVPNEPDNPDEINPPEASFLDILPDQCSNISDSVAYIIEFAVRFTDESPLGLFQLDMWVYDTDYMSIGSYNYGSGWEFQGISVGMKGDMAWMHTWTGSYTLQKLDMDGDTLYSVSREKDFIMRFNITGEDPEYVELSFMLPYDMDMAVNVTGWHEEIVHDFGGWHYDDVLETYVWDASLPVTYNALVFGEYQEKQMTNMITSTEVNVTVLREEWNETTQTWNRYLVNETHYPNYEFYLIYNQTTGTFNSYFGYTICCAYPYDEIIPDTWNEELRVIEEPPEDLPIFYELNTTECSATRLNGELVVDFVGHFTKSIRPTDQCSYLRFNSKVVGPENWWYSPATWGENPRQTQSEFDMAHQIAIETPVTIARILLEDGREPNGWMFQVDKGTNFMVKGRLQGGGEIASDIDGAIFNLECNDGYWTEEEHGWSSLSYSIQYEMSGVPTLKAFNMTQKENYTFGTYMDWVYTNFTGWHEVYSESTNTWSWEYGEYWEWAWIEVEGWHWQWWYFNQMTGEWQEKWINWRGPETVVPADFAETTDFHTWVDGGDLFVTFLVNMSDIVPDTHYWWDFAFMNNTWYEDFSSEYGEHEVLSWDREWIYSFDYMGDKVYMEPFMQNQLAFTLLNGTPGYYLGKETPYITIAGEDLPLRVIENYDPWDGTIRTEMLFYQWDEETQRDSYYYELLNGTEIEVEYDEIYSIYNVTTGDGNNFLTGMQWDWGLDYDGQFYSYWVDIYGNMHYGDAMYYSRPNLLQFELIDTVVADIKSEGWYIRYDLEMLIITDWRYSSIDDLYYLTDIDGNLFTVRYNYGTWMYEILVDGIWYEMPWTDNYAVVEYEGEDIMFFRWQYNRFYYHKINDIKYELPYPGANAYCDCDLYNTESHGGRVPTTQSLLYDGTWYPLYNITMFDLYVDIQGLTYEVMQNMVPYSSANGTDIWNPNKLGFRIDVGTIDDNLQFSTVESVDYMTMDMYGHPDHGTHPINGDEYDYITLNNGTTWIVNNTEVFQVFEYNLTGTIFYSTQQWPYYMSDVDSSWYEYRSIDGTIYMMGEYKVLEKLNAFRANTYHNQTDGFRWFEFMGQHYRWECNGEWLIYTWKVHNATSPENLYLAWEMLGGSHEFYNFTYKGEEVIATANLENIYKMRIRWGHALVYGPTPILGTTYKNFYDLVIGIPEWGMWGMQNWAVNTDNGALDLDGDLDTANDQYYVLEEYTSVDSWTHTWDFMGVNIHWDPNGTIWGDEMDIHSWLGVDTFTWTYEWSQNFYWFDTDMVALSGTEMQVVKDTLLTDEDEPRPGYWDIAWMARNTTWEDILAEAEEQGWDWISSNEQTWTWLSFGVGQHYGTSYEEGDVDHWLEVGTHYEFSGLMIWQDLNNNSQMDVDLENPGYGELSHYLIPMSVDGVSFVTPGEAYGNFEQSDWMNLGITDEVTWGVTFHEVNGTAYPFTLGGYWGWYDEMQTGSDLRTFDEKPTDVVIDEISFLVHFQGYLNETSLNNWAEIKVDNYVGNWDVNMIGGRDNLVNRSLALNYFADVNLHDFAFKAGGEFAQNEQTVSAETFELETSGARFAEMIMGGVAYDWGKDTSSRYDVVSYTTPLGTFRAAFESDSGHSATAWSFSSQMYYVTIGFPEWEGYSVFQDPVFVSYTSAIGTVGAVNFGYIELKEEIKGTEGEATIEVDISSQAPIDHVELMYSTDGENWFSITMEETYAGHYVATLPSFEIGTNVQYKIVVHTAAGSEETDIFNYTVGQSTATTTTYTTGGEFGPLDTITLLMLVGIALMLGVVIVVLRRKK